MDKEAVKAAVTRHSEAVLKTAFLYMKNTSDAEDVAQDVFLELLKTKKEFNSEEHLKAWLIRVAINKSKDILKSSWRSKRSEMPENPISPPLQKEDIVLEAMFRLEDKYRICREYEKKSVKV
ncbi:MAG: RNA polymerase sigma factor [Clostridiales bacterium]|nr:RNA polymerase sigma factor [Clostridiales bacterium]